MSISQFSGEDIFRAFVEHARADPMHLSRLAAVFNYAAPFKRAAPILPLPFSRMKTVEVSFEDKGPAPQPKGTRPMREALRFQCIIQVTTPLSSQISKPCWRGRAQFRLPSRMLHDAAAMRKSKKISIEYLDWLTTEVVPLAAANDWLIGCIRITTEAQGTPYADRQIILVDRVGAEAHQLDTAYLLSGEGILARLPPFVKTYPNGKQLAGSFALQSRAIRANDQSKLAWATGEMEVTSAQ
jgi:hypothetical protein